MNAKELWNTLTNDYGFAIDTPRRLKRIRPSSPEWYEMVIFYPNGNLGYITSTAPHERCGGALVIMPHEDEIASVGYDAKGKYIRLDDSRTELSALIHKTWD